MLIYFKISFNQRYYTTHFVQEGSRELEAELEAQLEQVEIKNKENTI